jgi:hypothetical protein
MFKLLGVGLVALAIVTGVVPQITDCLPQESIPASIGDVEIMMKCQATARTELVLSIPLALIGGSLFLGHRKENQRNLSALGVILGIFVMLLPTNLIGVCLDPTMACHNIMQPVLLFTGGLIALGGGAGVIMAERRYELAL